MSSRPSVAVIGGGASGCLTAAQLARCARRTGTAIDILLIGPGPLGRGIAYGTGDDRHLLNVPSAKMSAWPDEPHHFVRWLTDQGVTGQALMGQGLTGQAPPAGGFAARHLYGTYLQHCLDEALRAAPDVRFEHVPGIATDVRRHGRRLRVSLGTGISRPVDAVVLAIGAGRPATQWAPPPMRRSRRFVPDPWSAAFPPVPDGDTVLLVGTGLTMLDMARSYARAGVRVHVTSRSGLGPLAHAAATTAAPAGPPELPARPSAADARAVVSAQLRAHGGDWRAAVDSLRPVTALLWRRLRDDDRGALLRTAGRRWNQVRHRAAAELVAWYDERVAAGDVVVHRAAVSDAAEAGDHLAVRLSDGADIRASLVVNCTGPDDRIATRDDALVLNMLASGLVRPGPLGLGLAAELDGRVVAADGLPAPIWAMGALRKGELWETTAIPEIRVQAGVVARGVLTALPRAGIQRRVRDPFGLPVTASAGASALYVQALQRILRVQSGAETLVRQAVAADPGFALGHAVHALLDVVHGDPGRAHRTLSALPPLDRIGGSAAQREIVAKTAEFCAGRAVLPAVSPRSAAVAD